jgi:alanine racemase
VKKILEQKDLNLEALCSHLSSADETVNDFTNTQIERFKKAIETISSMGVDLSLNNLANSAGVMAHKDAHFNMVRPGIMLYGGLPYPGFDPPRILEPVMRFEGRILQIKDYPRDTPISYGRTYYTKGNQRIAVISAGYGDGLPRNLSNKGKVLIRGRKCNIVGRVCMNMTMCDITGMQDIVKGDEVILMGRQGEETISGDDLAIWGETISYEIFCSIGQRDIREYIS